MPGYQQDLAYIHDAGFGGFAVEAAPGILAVLHRNGTDRGLVVDLGCGSGIWARELTRAGYDVLGVDISNAMVALARRKVPRARFVTASLLQFDLPPCAVVTSLGECLNYTFDPSNSAAELASFFRRVYSALLPGGLFVFDIAEPTKPPTPVRRSGHWEGEDWVCLLDAEEDRRRSIATRRITTFRRRGTSYRRSDEVHVVRLYSPPALKRDLERAGFRVQVLSRYGAVPLRPGHSAFIARKPR